MHIAHTAIRFMALATIVNVPPPVTTKDGTPPITTKDGITAGTNFGDIPTRAVCQRCRKPVLSLVNFKVGLGTWLIAVILALLPPLCFIPFFVNACKDTEHTCPSCGNVMGVNKVIG